MIIRPSISRGKSIKAATKYLVQAKDHKGEIRETVRVVLGDKKTTDRVGKETKSVRPYTSGVIAFSKKIQLTDEQIDEISARHKELLLGNMADSVNCFYVQHTDKDKSSHVHFIVNNKNLENGKAFNPYPMIKGNNKLAQSFNEAMQRVLSYEYGLEYVPSKNTRFYKRAINYKASKHNEKLGIALRKVKQFEEIILKGVKNGDINNRKEMLIVLAEAGVKFSRVGDNYISIDSKATFKDGSVEKNIRLSSNLSEIFSEKNSEQAITELRELINYRDKNVISDETYQKDLKFIEEFTSKRNEYANNYKSLSELQPRFVKTERVQRASVPSNADTPIKPSTPNTQQPQAGLQAVSASAGGSVAASITALISQIAEAEKQYGVNSIQVIKLKVQLQKLQRQEIEQKNKEAQEINEINQKRGMRL